MGKEPRPILLKLPDTQTQRTVLSKAKNLKQADTETSSNVYIVPDKTPKEREKYLELQKELKERKDKGETDLMIRDVKVVKRRDGRQRVTYGKEVSKKANQGIRGKSNIREKLLSCACSPKRAEAITRQTNERNVNSKSDLENTQNYLLDCYCANA